MKKFLIILIVLVILVGMGMFLISYKKNNEEVFEIDESWNEKLKNVHGFTMNLSDDIKIKSTKLGENNEFELIFKSNKTYEKGKILLEEIFLSSEGVSAGGNYNDETLSKYLNLEGAIISDDGKKSFEARWSYDDGISNRHTVIASVYGKDIKIEIK